MTTRVRNLVRNSIVAAGLLGTVFAGGVGIASASNPSDLPQMNSGNTLGIDGCEYFQDGEGVEVVQHNPYCFGSIGSYDWPLND